MAELDYISKGDKTVNGQYKFVSHDQVTAKIHKMLVKHRVNAVPTVAEMTQEGNRTTVKLLMTFVNVDIPTDSYTVQFYGQGIDAADKGVGKAISYATKYAILKTFHLETGDDPDNDANSVYEPPKCLEFDLKTVLIAGKERDKLDQFLAHSAETLKKPIEDVKREALARFDDFMKAFNKWNAPVKKKRDE